MKIREQRKKIILVLLLILFCSIGLGYALLQTTLTINGTSKIKGNTWDIHFENLNVTDGSVELSAGDIGATIQTSRTDITYTVTLNKPGDFYEFTVDAVNAGSIDGMVESVTSNLNNQPITTLPIYLKYSVTYETNDKIQVNHLLKAGERETYKVRIEFKKDILSSDLPTTVQALTLDFGVDYIQADSNGVEIDHSRFVYTVNKYDSTVTEPPNNSVWLNQAYPEIIPYFETPEEALSTIANASNRDLPSYIKLKVENGIVTEQYVEFVVSETLAEANSGMVPGVYSLRGEKTYENGSYVVGEEYISPYYESNKEALKTAFGYSTDPNRCAESGTGRSSTFQCNVSGLGAIAFANGKENAGLSSNGRCYIHFDGEAYCSWS